MSELKAGDRVLVRKLYGGNALYEVTVEAIAPSGRRVKFSDIGWIETLEFYVVEQLNRIETDVAAQGKEVKP